MGDFGISYILKFIYSILTIILLVFIYTYLTNLEAKGCICAKTANTDFIKGFTLFAIIYLIFTGVIPDKSVKDTLGSAIFGLYKFIDIVFILIFIYYIYSVFQYTRYLVNEKCKCSEDIRREIIMIGSLIEFGLIFLLFLLHIILFTIYLVAYNVVKEVNDSSENIRNVIRDPLGSLTKVPKTLGKEISNMSNYVKKTTKELSKVASQRKTKK
jgi:hypothetical protein